MKIQIGVCGRAWLIRLASGWVLWDLGMSAFLICLSFVFDIIIVTNIQNLHGTVTNTRNIESSQLCQQL